MKKKGTLCLVSALIVILGISMVCRGAEITLGPVLELPGSDTMTVVWETDSPVRGSLVYKTPSGREIAVPSVLDGTQHIVRLTGLSPATRYEYTILLDGFESYRAWFSTLPIKGPYRVVFMGDLRHNNGITADLLSLIDTAHPQFIVLLGDLVNKANRPEDWKTQVFDPGKKVFDHIPVFGVPGNHDVQYDPDFTMFTRYFVRPEGAPRNSLTFSEILCGDRFIFLDIYSRRPFFAFTEGRDLIRMLKDAYFRPEKRHVFVLTHEGVISFWHLRRGYSGLRPFTRLMKKYGVTAVISGHDHHYARGMTYSGLPFFITGGGGSTLYDINKNNFYAAVTGKAQVLKKTHHFLIMDVDGDTCTFSAVLPDGTVFDTSVIRREH